MVTWFLESLLDLGSGTYAPSPGPFSPRPLHCPNLSLTLPQLRDGHRHSPRCRSGGCLTLRLALAKDSNASNLGSFKRPLQNLIKDPIHSPLLSFVSAIEKCLPRTILHFLPLFCVFFKRKKKMLAANRCDLGLRVSQEFAF
jgi:hypothetical protein